MPDNPNGQKPPQLYKSAKALSLQGPVNTPGASFSFYAMAYRVSSLTSQVRLQRHPARVVLGLVAQSEPKWRDATVLRSRTKKAGLQGRIAFGLCCTGQQRRISELPARELDFPQIFSQRFVFFGGVIWLRVL